MLVSLLQLLLGLLRGPGCCFLFSSFLLKVYKTFWHLNFHSDVCVEFLVSSADQVISQVLQSVLLSPAKPNT